MFAARASVYGHSSGAGLVLRAAAAGLLLQRIVLHDPPYATTAEEQQLAWLSCRRSPTTRR